MIFFLKCVAYGNERKRAKVAEIHTTAIGARDKNLVLVRFITFLFSGDHFLCEFLK